MARTPASEHEREGGEAGRGTRGVAARERRAEGVRDRVRSGPHPVDELLDAGRHQRLADRHGHEEERQPPARAPDRLDHEHEQRGDHEHTGAAERGHAVEEPRTRSRWCAARPIPPTTGRRRGSRGGCARRGRARRGSAPTRAARGARRRAGAPSSWRDRTATRGARGDRSLLCATTPAGRADAGSTPGWRRTTIPKARPSRAAGTSNTNVTSRTTSGTGMRDVVHVMSTFPPIG